MRSVLFFVTIESFLIVLFVLWQKQLFLSIRPKKPLGSWNQLSALLLRMIEAWTDEYAARLQPLAVQYKNFDININRLQDI